MATIPQWSMLRTIGHSRIARATVFIPVLGYLFIFNEQLTGLLKLLPAFGNEGSANEVGNITLSRLICLYLGLSLVGVASILFVIFCPSEIYENSDEHEFNVKEISIMTPFRFEMIRQKLVELRHLGSPELQIEIDRLAQVQLSELAGPAGMTSPELRRRPLTWTDWLERNKNDLSNIVSVKYQLLDLSLFDVRATITSLYLAGAIFLLLPSGQVFVKSMSLLKTVGQFLFRL